MAKWTYEEALRRLLADEGGYGNHPADPGGPTNFGITLADYRKYLNEGGTAADVRDMTKAQAKQIYRAHYWSAMRCDELPAGVDYAAFDYAVNSGNGRALKVMRRLCGLPDSTKPFSDSEMVAILARDPKQLAAAICDERLAFLQSLKTWPTFGRGWGRRVAGVKLVSVGWAGRDGPPAVPAEAPIHEAVKGKGGVPESKTLKRVISTGVPTATGAGGATFWDWVTSNPLPSILLAVAIGAAVLFVLKKIKDNRHKKQLQIAATVTALPALVATPG